MRAATALMVLLAVGAGPALADPWKDESGKGKWRRTYSDPYSSGFDRGWYETRAQKEKVRTAEGCELERKWKKGEYEEKLKCKGLR